MPVTQRFRNVTLGGAFVCVALVLGAMLSTSSAFGDSASRSYVVVVKDDVAHPANLAHRHEANRGAEVTHVYGVALKGYSAELTPGQVKAIEKDPNVRYVESDGVISPKGQAVGNQLKRVYANTSQLHIDENDVPADRVNADIAILDTGVYAHPDLNIVSRVVCVGGGGGCKPGQPNDDTAGHGTHVAGDAAAIDNGIGAVGTAPGARIWSVKVVNKMGHIGYDEVGMSLGGAVGQNTDLQDGNALMSDAIAGINYVTAHSSEIEVANMSFACATPEWGCARTALAEAIATSVNNGVVWVAAAGQEGQGVAANNFYKIRHYPALLSDVITVSAMADYDGLPGSLSNANACPHEKGEHDDRLMGDAIGLGEEDDFAPLGSNYGPEVDIAAPGSCVFSTWSPNVNFNSYDIPYKAEYGFMNGSSVASALVAGAAADIAAQYNPNDRAGVTQVRNILINSGNYNWEDLAPVGDGGAYISPDGVKEPLLDMRFGPPSVTTGGVENVTTSSAKLLGWLNPNGGTTNFYFQYGTTASYGASVPAPPGWSAGSGTSAFLASYDLSGLAPATTYHYRLVASNVLGTVTGADQTFTTAGLSGLPAPAAVISGGQPYVYYGLANGEMKQLRFNGTSWVGTNYGTSVAFVGTPSAVATSDGSRRVFYRGSDNALHEWWINGSNWSEAQWGADGAMGGDPSAVVAPDGTRYVYFRAADGSMRQWRIASATNWNESTYGATGALSGTPSAVAMADGSRRVFYRGTDNALHEWWINGPDWNLAQWGSTGVMASNPSAVVTTAGTRYVYFKGANGHMRQWRITSPTDWHEDEYGATIQMAGTPSAVAMADGSRRVFYRAADNSLHEWWISGANWSNAPWGSAEAMGGEPAAITGSATGRDAYYRARNGLINRWGLSGANYSLESSIG
jgi:hypothetical protein